MKTIDKILVTIDADEDAQNNADGFPVELKKALSFITNKNSVQLTLVSVGYKTYLSSKFYSIGYDYSSVQKQYIERMEVRMASLVGILREQNYRVGSEVVWAHPRYEHIVAKAEELDADLVVQHTRAYAKLERNHLTNDSWQLVRTCPRPLLLVKDRPWPQRPILIAAVDPVHSHHKPLGLDFKILDAAITAKAHLGGELHVLHAYLDTARPFATSGALFAEHSKVFRDLVSEYNLGESHLHLVDETPIIALQQLTQQLNSDIVVMGAVSRSRLRDALIGNTAEQILDYLNADALIIKPG